MRGLTIVVIVAGLSGCSPTYGVVKEAPKTVEPKAPPPPLDLSNKGRRELLTIEFEMKGYVTVWMKDTKLLITLQGTKWDLIGDDSSDDSREGRATFVFEQGSGSERRTIVEGQTKTVMGYEISVSLAYEYYRESDARFMPHARLTVRRKK